MTQEQDVVTPARPFSVTSPPAANETKLGPDALTSYVSFLRLASCTPSPILPGTNTRLWEDVTGLNSIGFPNFSTFPPSSSLPPPSSLSLPNVPSSTNGTSVGLETKYRIVIGLTVPFTALALTLVGVVTCRQYRRRKRLASAKAEATPPGQPQDTQPYLQPKAELEAEERMKHELEARERRFEVDAANEIHEMVASGDSRRVTVLQELRGAEHSRELEAPT